MIQVSVANRQSVILLAPAFWRELSRFVLEREEVPRAKISIALVDNETIHRLNRQFLQHDYPTDVLTFPLSESRKCLEGEIVVSGEYAAEQAVEYQTSPEWETALYIVHGVLHLCGWWDDSDERAEAMERRQTELLEAYLAAHPLAEARRIVPNDDEDAGGSAQGEPSAEPQRSPRPAFDPHPGGA